MEAAGERVLVNFFYAQPVGHAVEALHYLTLGGFARRGSVNVYTGPERVPG